MNRSLAMNRLLDRRTTRAAALLALALLGGCVAPGPVDFPVARNLTWFSYVGGDDLRATCTRGAPDRYRLVYNAIYTEQVRSYDIRVLPATGGARMEVRVAVPARFGGVSIRAPLVPWKPRIDKQTLSRAELADLVDAMNESGVFDAAPRGLELRSGAFYWVVSSCRDGAFHLNAFVHPSSRFDRLAFVEKLAGLGPSDTPFNPPRVLDRPPPLPGQCTSRRDPRDECLYPPFLLVIGDDGLVGSAFF